LQNKAFLTFDVALAKKVVEIAKKRNFQSSGKILEQKRNVIVTSNFIARGERITDFLSKRNCDPRNKSGETVVEKCKCFERFYYIFKTNTH